ncbi:MAG: hypothetical protein ABR599_05835 [Gemmatimonadota bacterium]
MSPSNAPTPFRPPRGRGVTAPRSPGTPLRQGDAALRIARLVAVAMILAALACGRPDSATLEENVRLQLSHEPPGSAPAGLPFLLGLRISATPPLDPGSAHLWWASDGGDWVRAALEPLAGTDRLEAELPAQPRGATVRYWFAVQSALGDTVRLPMPDPEPGAAGAADRDTYELLVRAPVAAWASGARGAGAAAGLLLVLTGAWAAWRRSREAAAGTRVAARTALAGVALFAVAGVGGAMAASHQATGNFVREVPPSWWVALLLWAATLPVLLRLERAPAETGRGRRALVVLAIALASAGGVAVAVGLARLL